MRRRVRLIVTGFLLALLGAAAALAPGCSYVYHYEVRVNVRGAADGAPLGGVRVSTNAGGFGVPAEECVTAGDGTFASSMTVSPYEFRDDKLPHWALTLSRDGFADEVLDISPRRKPKDGQPPTQIVVAAYLRPKQP